MSAQHSSPDGRIPFAFFVSLIEAIGAIKPRKVGHRSNNGTSQALRIFQNWVAELHRCHDPLPAGATAVVFRLLFPEDDHDRKYGMQETRLAQYLADIFAVSTSPDGRGNALITWNCENVTGCLGSEIHKILQLTSHTGDSLSIFDVDKLLTKLASTCSFSASSLRRSSASSENESARRSKLSILRELYSALSPAEARVVTQIILKDLRPLLYPLPDGETHYTTLLLQYNSNACATLSLYQAIQAWDPSGRMLATFRVRARIEEAAREYDRILTADDEYVPPRPQVGIPIQIPKCLKGQGCAHSLQLLRGSKKVWAETKYDGERAQIHVNLSTGIPHISIFSKSGRDSTFDRIAIHPIIRDALGIGSSTCQIKTDVILEAEMVAFSDVLDRIDEFWRIRSLIASTAIGPRHARPTKTVLHETQGNEENASQCSLVSNASDGGTRRLALVFFDVLLLNGRSLLSLTYSERRTTLESIIGVEHGRSMLAERRAISLGSSTLGWAGTGEAQLREAFARHIADHQEGVVLKADEGKYNERRLPWVKLKKDYIPCYGDTVDLILVGAVWEKDRARELRVAPAAFTTFYIGALSNKEAHLADPNCRPHFEVIFTVSYGLSREALEELNFMIRSSEPVKNASGQSIPGLSYTYTLFQGLPTPAVILRQPLLVELFGAGFSKAAHGQFYELRFPRLTKVYRSSERSWTDSVTLQEFQAIAREAVGRDRPNKDVDDWCNSVWGKPSSPGAKSPVKRKLAECTWTEKLEKVDQKEASKKRRKSKIHGDSPFSTAAHGVNGETMENSRSYADRTKLPHRLRALGSMTNISLSPAGSSQGESRRQEPQTTTTAQSRHAFISPSASTSHCQIIARSSPQIDRRSTLDEGIADPNVTHNTVLQQHVQQVAALEAREAPIALNRVIEGDVLKYASTPLGFFLQKAVVWLARQHNSPRPSWRVPSSSIIPSGHQVYGLESFLKACNWSAAGAQVSPCTWAEYGVVFVDDTGNGAKGEQWMDYPLKVLMNRRASLVTCVETIGCKPIWVLSMKMLSHEELRKTPQDVERRAICRLG